MKLDKVGDRIHLTSSYDPELVETVKQISGARWAKTYRAWTFPLTLTAFRSLRRSLDKPTLSAELKAWAQEEIRMERKLRVLQKENDAELRVVPSVFPATAKAMESRVYQRAGARFLAESGGRMLLADEPGLGKTAQVFAGLTELGALDGTHLIFATTSAGHSVWARQAAMWAPGTQVVVLPTGADARRKAVADFLELDTPRFLVAGYASVRRLYGQWCKVCEIWEEDHAGDPYSVPEDHYLDNHSYKRALRKDALPELMAIDWDAVILDESHKALAAYVPANISQQTQALLDLKRKYPIALTGTPLRGAEERIWGTLDWLGLKTGGYWGWMAEFFVLRNNGFGKVIEGVNPEKRDLLYRTLDRYVLRRTRAEVRPDLPLGQRHVIKVPLEGKHRAQYMQFATEAEVAMASGTVYSLGLLSELTRLKQMAYGVWTGGANGKLSPTVDSPKLRAIVDWLAERGVAGRKDSWLPEDGAAYKYVIASQSTEIIDSLERELNKLGIATFKITGSVKGRDRTRYIETFQSKDRKTRVMLLNTVTGGESIELDAWCDEMIICDETYIADDQVQLEGRINNRSGRVSPRSWYYLVTEETIEEEIHRSNQEQHNLQHLLLDKRRGVETALHLMGRR